MSDVIVPHPNTRILKGYKNVCKNESKPVEHPLKKEYKHKISECSKSVNYKFPTSYKNDNFKPVNYNCLKIQSIKLSTKSKPVSVKPLEYKKLDCKVSKIDNTFDWPDPKSTKWRWNSEYTFSN
jgi:hypothetical protein